MGLTLQSAPATEPITTAEAKSHLRVDTADEDPYIDTLVASARRWVEQVCNRALVTQTWDWTLDRFPMDGALLIRLPLAPVSAITSVTYLNADGDSTVWGSSNYVLAGSDIPPRLALAPNAQWPSTESGRINAVTVRLVAGYGDASDVPEDIKHAIKLLVAQMYTHRAPEITGTIVSRVQFAVNALLAPYRIY